MVVLTLCKVVLVEERPIDVLKVAGWVEARYVNDTVAPVETESFEMEMKRESQQTLGKSKPPTFSLPHIKLFSIRFGKSFDNGLVRFEINWKKGSQRKYKMHAPATSSWDMHRWSVVLETKV